MKRTRSKAELCQELQDQVGLLQGYCLQFDEGNWVVAKPMSAALRILLDHPDKPQPQRGSLLAQLGLRGGFWLDSTRMVGVHVPKEGGWAWPQLLMMQVGEQGTGFQPKLLNTEVRLRRTPFLQWWSNEVATHSKYGAISRKRIVKCMADQDGGAHVDGQIDEGYDAFSRGLYLNITVGDELARGAVQACVRTIVHETILTIHRYEPGALAKPYRWRALASTEVSSVP